MKVASLVLLITASFANAQSGCTTRPSWTSMTTASKMTFINAVKSFKSSGGYDTFTKKHMDNAKTAHGVPAFLIWHRAFLYDFEKAIGVPVPYWDTAADANAPHKADVFDPQFFGGNGNGSNRCVADGQFTADKGWVPTIGATTCLKRCFDGTRPDTIGAFFSPEAEAGVIASSKDYESFRQAFEGGAHARVHNGIGGDCGDMSQMYSPNDPLFYLHHANVDRVFARWQKTCKAYGKMFTSDADLAKTIPGYSYTFADGLDDGFLCHQYSDGNNVPVAPNCPSTTTNPNPATATTGSASTAAVDVNNLEEAWLINTFRELLPGSSSSSLVFNATRKLFRRENDMAGRLAAYSLIDVKKQVNIDGDYSDKTYRPDMLKALLDPASFGGQCARYVQLDEFPISAPAEDEDDDILIHHPKRISDAYIKKMNLNEQDVRAAEVYACHIVDAFNNRQGYISPCSSKRHKERKSEYQALLANY